LKEGEIRFAGQHISGLPTDEICRRGIGRTCNSAGHPIHNRLIPAGCYQVRVIVSKGLVVCNVLIYQFLKWLLPKFLNSNFVSVDIIIYSTMIGYLSHLVADSLTKEGLPLFFPLKFKIGFPPIKSLRITTDSWVEKYLVLPSIAIYLFWFISLNGSKLLNLLKMIT